MAETILFLMSAVGLMGIVTTSTIMEPLRARVAAYSPRLGEGIACSQCVGFWAGVVSGFVFVSWDPARVVLLGCAGSAASVAYANFMEYLAARSFIDLGDER